MKYSAIYLMAVVQLFSIISCNTSTNSTAEMDDRLNEGKQLFVMNCNNCHKTNVDFTGPALAQCRKREPNEDWAYKFVTSTNMMLNTDPYAIALYQKYGSMMQEFPEFNKEQIKAILDYCDSAAIYNQTSITP